MRPRYALPLLFLLAPTSLEAAQDEGTLRQQFEGTMVTVLMDMPGTEDGVDVYPGTSAPIDYPKYAQRLKTYGVALHSGQTVIVTKLKVKSDLIEFQLGGGGFGTMFDDTRTTVTATPTAKSNREKDLEKEVRSETDRDRKRRLQEELDDLKRDREREDRRNEASVAAASEQRRENIRRQRSEGGSRFNLRYRGGVPPSALSPAAVREALAKYVEFPGDASAKPGAAPATGIRLGMLLPEVEALLGPAVTAEERMEGTLHVSVRTYARPGGRITAELVEGVVIRFRQSAN
jgi:hypothetical protein